MYNAQKQQQLELLKEQLFITLNCFNTDADKFLDVIQIANILKIDVSDANELVQFIIKEHIKDFTFNQKKGFQQHVRIYGFYLMAGFKLVYPEIKRLNEYEYEVEFSDTNFSRKAGEIGL